MAPGTPEGQRRSVWFFLLGLWSLATGLNLLKPFHLDDAAHLLIAEQILREPWRPMSGLINWQDTAEPVFVTNQPHFLFYLIAGVVALAGWSETALHLLLAAFTLAAILAAHAIAARFVPRQALMVVAMLALGPGFLVNQNVMADMPLLALMSLAFLALLRRGGGDRLAGAAGFGAFSLAVLTKYTALFLYPALLWLSLARPRRLLWALLPVAVLVAWGLFNLADYGAVHMLARPRNEGGLVPSPRLAFALLVNLGVFVLPVAALLLLAAPGRLLWGLVFASGWALYLLAVECCLGYPREALTGWNALLFAAAVTSGAAALRHCAGLLVRPGRQGEGALPGRFPGGFSARAGETALALWLVGGVLFLATFPPFMATRHAMLIALPLTILALRGGRVAPGPGLRAAVLGLWAAVGVFVTLSDISYARFFRDQAPLAAERARVLAAPGAELFGRGHWGWQWYARAAGLSEYDTRRSRLAPGDILVDPVGIAAQRLPDPENYEPVATLRAPSGWLSMLDMRRFYASALSSAPVISLAPPREIRILRRR